MVRLPLKLAMLIIVVAGLVSTATASAQLLQISGQPSLGTVNLGSSVSETLVFQAQSAISDTSKAIAVTEGVKGLDFSVISDNCNNSMQTGDYCQIVVSFTPTVAGLRLGNITKHYVPGTGLTVPIYGVGYGPQVAFGPPTAISIGPSLNGALLGTSTYGIGGVALDGAGDLFISDPGNDRVVKVPAGGGAAISIPTVSEVGQLTFPTVLAVDGAGRLYIGNSLSSENPFAGSDVVVVLPGNQFGDIAPTVNGLGISYVSALVVDGAGDVFIADCGNTRVIEFSPITGVATAIDPTVNGVPLTCALGLAIDNSGDLLIADSSNDRIVQITNLGAGTASVLDTGVGLNYPYGLAVDGAGNLFIAEPNINQVWEVPAGGGSAIQVGSGLNFPNSVAVDGVGDLFISDGGNKRVQELQRPTAPSAVFAAPTSDGATDTTDGTQTVQVVNIGNASLTFSGVLYPADFAPATDANACTGSTVLTIDQECDIALVFEPLSPAIGPLSESVTLTDDNLNGVGVTQSVGATGTAVGPVATHFSVSAPASVNAGQSISVTVTALTAANLPTNNYTGTVTITSSDPAAVLPASGPLSNGVGTFSVTLNSLNFQTVTATDAVNSLTGISSGIDVGEGAVLAPESVGAGFGSQPVGTTSAAQGVSFSIGAGTTVGSFTVLTTGVSGKDFAYAAGGTCTATTYGSATTCTVNATFAPLAPGLRSGVVELLDPSGNLVAAAPVYGVGTGPLVDFLPATQSSLGSGLIEPDGVAVDAAGNIYVADSFVNQVKEIVAAGGYTTINILGGGFEFPTGVAVDGAGNVFVADYSNSAVKEIPPGCTTSSCVVVVGSGFSTPSGVAMDGSGNVFVADSGNNAVKEIEAAGGYTTVDTLGGVFTFNFPISVSVDGNGNVFVADYSNREVEEILAAGGLTTVNTLGSGFVSPVGVAVDPSGNVYVADAGTQPGVNTANSAVYEILAAGGYVTVNTLAQTVSPEGLALDGVGNVYVVADTSASVIKLDLADAPALNFTPAIVGTTSSDSPQTITVENNGNAALTIDVPSLGNNPSISGAAFALGSGSGTDCPLVISGTSAGTLAAGASCVLPVSFTPPLEGPNTGTLTLTDNDLNVDGTSQSIALSGLGGDAAQVTVGTSPGGLTFSVDGTLYGSAQTFNWITGQQHTLSTGVQTSVDGGTEYTPTGWSDGTTTATDLITVATGVTSYTASYSISYLLSATPNNGALGSVTPATFGYYAPGSVVNITATSTGGSFIGWTGSFDIAAPSSAATTITMNSPEIITANFTPFVSGTTGAVNFGSVAIGTPSAPQPVSVNILAGATVGSIGVFTQGSANLDFTAASGATCTPMTYSSATNCAVNVIFTPTAAGLREGAVVFFSGANNTGNLLGSVPIYGTGTGPQLAFYPAPEFAVPHSFVFNPYGVAVDGAGDLFVANLGAGPGSGPGGPAGSVVEVPAGGGPQIPLGSGWTGPTGIAVDGAGNVFVADFFGEELVELPAGGGAQFQIAYSGLPYGIAVDAADNLYIADPALAQVVELAAGTGAQTQIGSGWYGPTGVAVDAAGNVYVVDGSVNSVTQVAAGTGTLTPLTGPLFFTPTGWYTVTGVAVDGVGNVYVSDEYLGVVELAAGTFAATNPISGSTVSPNAVAVDAGGDVFAADYYSHSEIELQRSQPLAVSFPTPTIANTIDAADGPQTIQIQNIGNAPLTFPTPGSGNNPSISTNFTLNSSGAGACPLATSGSGPGTLAANASCQLAVSFAPAVAGPISGSLTLTDNALNATAPGYATQSIPLSGMGLPVPLTFSTNSLSYGIQVVGTGSASQSVTLTNIGSAPLSIFGIKITGANASSFIFGNTCGSSLAGGASCTIHGHFAPTVTGPLSASIVITDSSPGSPQTVALTCTGVVPEVSLSAVSLTYGLQAVGTSSASQSVTLTNTGGGPLTIISINVSGADASSFVFANTCTSSLAAGSSCTIHGHFAPTATGPMTAAIVITDHAGDSPQSITLTGTGATPAASLSATSLTYAPQAVGTESASQSVTLTNTGNFPLGIISIRVTGANASSFVFANNCGSSLAAGSSCTIHGHFAPTMTGPLGATIVITDHAADSPQSITLTGTGQ